MYIITLCISSVENPIMEGTKDLECVPHQWDLQRTGSKALLTLQKCGGRVCMLWFPWRSPPFSLRCFSFATHSAQSLQKWTLLWSHCLTFCRPVIPVRNPHKGERKEHFLKSSPMPFILWLLNTKHFFAMYIDFPQNLKEPRNISNCSPLVGDS